MTPITHTLIEKPASSTPTSANVVACRGLVTRPRGEQLNGHRAKAFWFTVLARVGHSHGNDVRTLLPWFRGVGDEIGLSRPRRSLLNLQLNINAPHTLDDLQRHLEAAMIQLDISVAALYLAPDGKLHQQGGRPAIIMSGMKLSASAGIG